METSSSAIPPSDVHIILIQSEKEMEDTFWNGQEMEEWISFVLSNP